MSAAPTSSWRFSRKTRRTRLHGVAARSPGPSPGGVETTAPLLGRSPFPQSNAIRATSSTDLHRTLHSLERQHNARAPYPGQVRHAVELLRREPTRDAGPHPATSPKRPARECACGYRSFIRAGDLAANTRALASFAARVPASQDPRGPCAHGRSSLGSTWPLHKRGTTLAVIFEARVDRDTESRRAMCDPAAYSSDRTAAGDFASTRHGCAGTASGSENDACDRPVTARADRS